MDARINRTRYTRSCDVCTEDIEKGSPQVITRPEKNKPRIHSHPSCWVDKGLDGLSVPDQPIVSRLTPEQKVERTKITRHINVLRHRMRNTDMPGEQFKFVTKIELLNRALDDGLGGRVRSAESKVAAVLEYQS